MRLELHPEARAELRRAALWYDERRSGLGDEFVAEVSAALDRIAEVPESHPPWPRTRASGAMIRKATIHRFPYVIAFEKHEQHGTRPCGCPRQAPTTLLAHPREPLSETGVTTVDGARPRSPNAGRCIVCCDHGIDAFTPSPECLQNSGRIAEIRANTSGHSRGHKTPRTKRLSPEVARHHQFRKTR